MDALVIRALAQAGYSPDQIVEIAGILEHNDKLKDAEARSEQRARSAVRSRNYRDRKKSQPPAVVVEPTLPPPSVKKKTGPKLPAVAAEPWPDGWFVIFWNLYPRKVGKVEAMRALERLQKAGVSFAKVMDGVGRISTDGDKKFIPHAATWLNQRRFEDEEASGPTTEKERSNGSLVDAQSEIVGAFSIGVDYAGEDDRTALVQDARAHEGGSGRGRPALPVIQESGRERSDDFCESGDGDFE